MPRSKPSNPRRNPPSNIPTRDAPSSSSNPSASGLEGLVKDLVVRVRHPGGMRRMGMEGLTTIGGLKRRIREELEIPASRQKLKLAPSTELNKDSQSLADAGIRDGTIVILQVTPAPKRSRGKEGEDGKKKTKRKKKTADNPDVYRREGKDPDDIARSIRLASVPDRSQMAETVYKQTLCEHRLSAAESDKVKATELLEASEFTSMAQSRGTKYLSVHYSHGRKKHKELVALYDDDTIKAVIRAVVRTHTTAARITVKSSLKAIGHRAAALVSPPLFWSVFHSFPNRTVESVFNELVTSAVDDMSIKTSAETS